MRVSVYVGDIAHNCRSALDQLAWQLVINHSGRPKRVQQKIDVEFPVKYRLEALKSTYTFSKVSPADRAIIKDAQLYHCRYNPKLHPLPVIWQLSNRDKHRMFNPMLVSTEHITVMDTVLEDKSVFVPPTK